MALTYHPEIFDVRTAEQAKSIILTAELGAATDERWEKETPYLAEMIESQVAPTPQSVILDYGCGIGRLSKAMIERFGCRVVGVDISASMRALAADHVNSERFIVCAPHGLDWLVSQGVRVDGAISIWVLQHCLKPQEDIERIRASMRPSARLFIVNNKLRAIPTREAGWADDGADVRTMLLEKFDLEREGVPAPEHVSNHLSEVTFWASYSAS